MHMAASQVTGIPKKISLSASGVGESGRVKSARADDISTNGGLYSLRLKNIQQLLLSCGSLDATSNAELCGFDDLHICI